MYAYAALAMVTSAVAIMAATLPPPMTPRDEARIAAETMARLHREARSRCAAPALCPAGVVPIAQGVGAGTAVTIRSDGSGMLVTAWAPPAGSRWASVPAEAVNAHLLEMRRTIRVSLPGPYHDGMTVGGVPVPFQIGGLSLSSRQPVIAARFGG